MAWTIVPAARQPDGYRVALDGTDSCTTTAPTCTVAELTNGRSYVVTVVAYDNAGDGEPSIPLTASPYGLPAAPATFTASIDPLAPTTAIAAFTPPADDGGRPVTSYAVSCVSTDGGSPVWVLTAETTASVLGLTPATTYTCTAKAHNEAGWSTPSTASGPLEPYRTPDAPVVVGVTEDFYVRTSVRVRIEPAGFNGGRPVTWYRTICTADGGVTRIVEGVDAPVWEFGLLGLGDLSGTLLVEDLTPGVSYRCVAQSRNLAGWSDPPGVPGPVFVPYRIPDAPLMTTWGDPDVPGTLEALVVQAPFDGGRPITRYRVECWTELDGLVEDHVTVEDVTGRLTIPGLTPGTPYLCRGATLNAAGWSEEASTGGVVPG